MGNTITMKDAMQYVRFSSLAILPGGKSAVFCARHVDVNAPGEGIRRRFYRIGLDGGGLRELNMLDGAGSLCPLNGRHPIAFVRGREVLLGDPEKDRSRVVAQLPSNPRILRAYRDGLRLLFIVETPSPEDARLRADGVVIEGREIPTQVFIADTATGRVRAVTSTPTVKTDADLSPDGRTVVFTEQSPEIHGKPSCSVLKIADIRPGKERVLVGGDLRCARPRFSPDGKRIAFLVRRPSVFADDHISLMSPRGGPARNLTSSLDRRVLAMEWTGDSRILFLLAEGMHVHLWNACPATGRLDRLSDKDRVWTGFAAAPGVRQILYTVESLDGPEELCAADTWGRGEKRLTDFNARLRAASRCRSEIIGWKNSAGMRIEGIWTRASREPKNGSPLVIENHGSTPGCDRASFAPVLRYHAHCGLSSLRVNYRGSCGYGREFTEANAGCWCTGPADDCVTGAGKLIAEEAVDPKRIGACGASGGVLMSAAAIGMYPGVFRTAVLVCGWYDFTGLYRSAFWQNVMDRMLGGSPQEVPEMYRRESPVTYAARVKIPVLLFCGEQDTAVVCCF